jgi:hypothetical protein
VNALDHPLAGGPQSHPDRPPHSSGHRRGPSDDRQRIAYGHGHGPGRKGNALGGTPDRGGEHEGVPRRPLAHPHLAVPEPVGEQADPQRLIDRTVVLTCRGDHTDVHVRHGSFCPRRGQRVTAGRLGAGVASCLIDCRPRPAPLSSRPHDICARRARSPQAVSVSADRKVCGLLHRTPNPMSCTLLAAGEPGLDPRRRCKRRATADLIAFLAERGRYAPPRSTDRSRLIERIESPRARPSAISSRCIKNAFPACDRSPLNSGSTDELSAASPKNT